ncbi:MAG: 50S ribosomal protein L17 [Candidatus Uhrbacteria bacterium]|jgi:large subunit ribosomal protein L17
MRHRNNKKILGREVAPRRALLRSLAESVILYEKVQTTEAKAKIVRPLVEKAISIGKTPTLAARRKLMTMFHTQAPVEKILAEIGPRYKTRAGGYTRIIKLGHRLNDAADMAQIELV